MRLHQFLSSVFPRFLRAKSERNRQRNSADQNAIAQKTNSNSQLELSDLKHAFDTVDPAHGHGSSTHREVTARNDCSQPQSVRGGAGDGGGITEEERDWVSEQSDDNRVSRSRSMIRTNPWLASPKSTHTETMQLQTGQPKSLPTTPTTSSVGAKTMEYRQALARREMGFLLMLQVPKNLDDSASEGYASSVFCSPSVTDLDSIEGGLDSALASSISSESDFGWGESLISTRSQLHAASAPGLGEVLDEVPFKVDAHCVETTNDGGERGTHSKTRRQLEDVSMRKDEEVIVTSGNCIDVTVTLERPTELKLVKCYDHSEHSFSEVVRRDSSRNQCECPTISERSRQTDTLRPQFSTERSEDSTELQGDLEQSVEDEEEMTESQNLDKTDDGNVSLRTLSQISEGLQDKVRRLHEQKSYVDALFHRAREADRQRESQYAQFRSQFVAAKRQALLRKLHELQTMLGSQSTKLQMVYDAVLLVQWPKVFNVCEARSTN